MSSNTVALNGTYNAEDTAFEATPTVFQEPEPPFLLVASLWLVQSIFFACKMGITGNMQGVSISFNMQYALLIAFATWMLYKGLSTENIAFILPRVIVMLYGLYFNHYESLKRMMYILKTVPQTTVLLWLAVFLTSVGIGIGLILILRTLQLSANLWYQRS